MLDERYFLYFEAIDNCLSARREVWKVVFYPHASVVHLGGQRSVKTGERVSAKGRQMIAIRITSEYRFHCKLYSRLRLSIKPIVSERERLWTRTKEIQTKST